jgi:hypothetical protein
VAALTLLGALATAAPAWAWGRIGHRLTARLAERHLNPKAKAAVEALLAPGESLADASTWADEHRRDIRGSGPWHYVDVPLDQDRYDARFSGPGPEKGCIVDKVREFVNILGNPDRPVEEPSWPWPITGWGGIQQKPELHSTAPCAGCMSRNARPSHALRNWLASEPKAEAVLAGPRGELPDNVFAEPW